MTYRTPAELVMALRMERGADVGPPPVGYAENRSLEAPDGDVDQTQPMFQLQFDPSTLPPPPPVLELSQQLVPMPRVIEVPAGIDIRGDFVDLAGNVARIGKFECQISEGEHKQIKLVVMKAIRRELRAMERS